MSISSSRTPRHTWSALPVNNGSRYEPSSSSSGGTATTWQPKASWSGARSTCPQARSVLSTLMCGLKIGARLSKRKTRTAGMHYARQSASCTTTAAFTNLRFVSQSCSPIRRRQSALTCYKAPVLKHYGLMDQAFETRQEVRSPSQTYSRWTHYRQPERHQLTSKPIGPGLGRAEGERIPGRGRIPDGPPSVPMYRVSSDASEHARNALEEQMPSAWRSPAVPISCR